jgi:hypothetical protein
MTRISSTRTFFMKRIFPLLFLVIMAIPVVVALNIPGKAPVQLFIAPLVLLPVLFIVMGKLVWDLADEVYDGGDYLLVKKGGKEERIPLSNIMNVSSTLMVNPPRITLRLVTPGKFGKDVTFSPVKPFSLNPFTQNAVAENLIERVDKARRGSR